MIRKAFALSLASALAIGGIFFPSTGSLTLPLGGRPSAKTVDTHRDIGEAYARLPLSFEANHGQTNAKVKFLSRSAHRALFLTPTEAVLVLDTSKDAFPRKSGSPRRPDTLSPTVLRMGFVGANPTPRLTGLKELPGTANYFIGRDPASWHTNVPTYARVLYEGLYPGIDLCFYSDQNRLEYDFVVHPGADPDTIALEFRGAQKLDVTSKGDLALRMPDGILWQEQKPVLYQEIGGIRHAISGSYVLRDAHQVGFRVGAYDTHRPLVIDPVLMSGASIFAYSTYLGGSNTGPDDPATGIAVDSAGNAYVTGYTFSPTFPTTAGAVQTTLGGTYTSFVTKFNPTGTALVYSTYLGGSGADAGFAIAVDSAGDAYVTGHTTSPNFPTTVGAVQRIIGGGTTCADAVFGPASWVCNAGGDAFVTELNPTGTALVYSTYLGGSGDDAGNGIAVDSAGDAYVTGYTTSTDFPTTVGAFQASFGMKSSTGNSDAFVTELNPTGTALVYSTYLGGTGIDQAESIVVDTAGNLYVTGTTSSANFPSTASAYQTVLAGSYNAFVTKLNSSGFPVYSTYLGGNGVDVAVSVAVDNGGNAYTTGYSTSTNFPTTSGAFQTTCSPACSVNSPMAFLTKLGPIGSSLVYSTYLGGTTNVNTTCSGSLPPKVCGTVGEAIAVDSGGNAYVTGLTGSTTFPTTMGAFETTYNNPCVGVIPLDCSGDHAFLTKLNSTGSSLVYSTYLEGSYGSDGGFALVLDSAGNVYVAGETHSTDFPVTAGAFQTQADGSSWYAFVAKIRYAALSPSP